MGSFFVIIIGWSLAILILYYRRPIKEFFGDIGFAEKYLGMGGTNTLIIIIGILEMARQVEKESQLLSIKLQGLMRLHWK